MKMILISVLLIALCVVHPGLITCLMALVSCACTMIMMLGSTLCAMVGLPLILLAGLVWVLIR
jgi:hypothetical protein